MSLFFVSDLTVLKDVRVSNSDYRVYSCLVSYMNKETGICYPRHATISKAIGMSRTAIYRSIKHLAKLGYVTVKRRSSTNEYYFCLLYTSPSPRDGLLSRMPSSA